MITADTAQSMSCLGRGGGSGKALVQVSWGLSESRRRRTFDAEEKHLQSFGGGGAGHHMQAAGRAPERRGRYPGRAWADAANRPSSC